MSPLDLRGPEFLALYVQLLAGAVVAALVLRWLLRTPADDPGPEALRLGPVEASLLAGGATRAFEAAVARLVAAGVVQVEPVDRTVVPLGPRPREGTALERAIVDAAGPPPGRKLDDVRRAVQPALQVAEARLASLGLRSPLLAARVLPVALLASLAGFGALKVLIGLQRDRPVGFLVVLVAGTLFLALVFASRPNRTRRGARALRQLTLRNDGLRAVTKDSAPSDVALAVALFGTAALTGPTLEALALVLRPPSSTSGGSSGCSSSSCGGGGGCGGGGCGGCGS